MSIVQKDIFGGDTTVVGGKSPKIEKPKNFLSPPQHFAGGKCRPCNYAENSDQVYGKHCGECDCCSEKLENNQK